jgi:exodeoxyribonuclease (lambda-induced)
LIHHQHDQGSPEWLAARKGLITGSMLKVARDRLKNGNPSKACQQYAMDLARERCGGKSPDKFQSYHMRVGSEQEASARAAYEAATGNLVEEVGFFGDEGAEFGCSPDGLIGTDGTLEIKCMVSSDTLFTAVVDGDVSEYMDQCLGYLWMLGREWVDLVLWAPDLEHITIKRITKADYTGHIEALEKDLLAFAQTVRLAESKLRKVLKT